MARKGVFFRNVLLSLEEELALIDLNNFKAYFGKVLPGEKIIGELNDKEKRMVVWIFQMAEKVREIFKNSERLFLDPVIFDLYLNEYEIIRAKTEIILLAYEQSVLERLGSGIQFDIREDFKIVNSNKVADLAKKEINNMLQAMFKSNYNEAIN